MFCHVSPLLSLSSSFQHTFYPPLVPCINHTVPKPPPPHPHPLPSVFLPVLSPSVGTPWHRGWRVPKRGGLPGFHHFVKGSMLVIQLFVSSKPERSRLTLISQHHTHDIILHTKNPKQNMFYTLRSCTHLPKLVNWGNQSECPDQKSISVVKLCQKGGNCLWKS